MEGLINSFLKLFTPKDKPQFLEALQIEVSAKCNLRCKFCPTTFLNFPAEQQLLSLALYKKLTPYFPWTKWVYLQGWGEPLLNPSLWEMITLAKKSGAKVGLTTNGTLLNTKNIEHIFTSQVDLISISIAGAKPATHNKLRVNSNLPQILEAIKKIVAIKKYKKTPLPLVKISYMLTKETIAELPQAVKIAHSLGVDDFYTTNLDYLFDKNVNNSKLFTYFGEPNPLYERYILQAQKFAKKHKFPFRTYPLTLREQLAVCELDPNRFIFITANGEVTPCTYLGRFKNPRYFQEQFFVWPRKTFGNIENDSLEAIWHSTDYINFRTSFATRFAAYQDFISTLNGFEPSPFTVIDAEKRYQHIIKNTPVPQECQTCPKMYGV